MALRSIPVAAALSVGLAVLGAAAAHHAAPASALLLPVGFDSGVMTLYFQLLSSERSTTEARGSALALGGLGWGLSHLSTPLAMGVLKDAFGIEPAFYAMGAVATARALLLAPLHAWAFRGGHPR